MRAVLFSLLVLAGPLVAAQVPAYVAAPSEADRAAVRAAALDYLGGWYEADTTRMRRALHPHLAKRIVRVGPDGSARLDEMTAAELVSAAGQGFGARTPEAARIQEVYVLDIDGDVATVKTVAAGFIDYIHLARWEGAWRIVNVLWALTPPPGD